MGRYDKKCESLRLQRGWLKLLIIILVSNAEEIIQGHFHNLSAQTVKWCLRPPLVESRKSEFLIWTLPPCGFSKSVFSKEREKPWFFVTFNIILRHIFPENFIEFPQVVQKIWRNSLSILANFHQFSSIFWIFWIFWHYLLTKKTNGVSL